MRKIAPEKWATRAYQRMEQDIKAVGERRWLAKQIMASRFVLHRLYTLQDRYKWDLSLIDRAERKGGKEAVIYHQKRKKQLEDQLDRPSLKSHIKTYEDYLSSTLHAYDEVDVGDLNEKANILGISENALKSIINKRNIPEKEQSIVHLAFVYHAEDFFEKAPHLISDNRYPVIWWAFLNLMMRRKKEDPVTEYIMDSGLHEFFPEIFPKPVPKRDFKLV